MLKSVKNIKIEFDFDILGKWVHSDMKKMAVFGFAFEYLNFHLNCHIHHLKFSFVICNHLARPPYEICNHLGRPPPIHDHVIYGRPLTLGHGFCPICLWIIIRPLLSATKLWREAAATIEVS